jgi:hypothetical protein
MSITGARLLELAEELADTPTLSAFVSTDPTRRRGGTHGVWRTQVAEFAREVRFRHAGIVGHADRDAFERNLRRLELRLRGLPHAVRAPGWFVVVARGDVHYCAPAPFAGESEARWQQGPWLSPLLTPPAAAITSQDRRFLLTPAER